ncbi:contactin-6-like isoform X2 [Channa argus]|uniref:contactin-6-like isoform X2 n=1 Tax=Channa argus TaxID=215402 RepID=UPI00352232DF
MLFSLKMKMLVVVVILLHVSQHGSGLVVEVYKGEESVLLPCQMLLNSTFSDATVVWNHDSYQPLVHFRDKDGDNINNQNKHYLCRTSMRDDALQTGDLSLKLRNPTSSDSGAYTCTVRIRGINKDTREVQLSVTEPPPPVWTKVLAGVLVPLLVLAVVGFTWYRWSKDRIEVQQVEVDSGVESVQLPCRTTVLSVCSLDYLVRLCHRAPLLPEDVRVKWTDNNDKKVHVFEKDSDKPEEQDSSYRHRTEMKKNLLKTGDLSLTLKKPTYRDRGIYTCTVYNREGNILMKKDVILQVKVPQVEVDSGVESVQLPCKTTVHLPEDATVEWRDKMYRKVHVYQNGSDQPEEQFLFYKGRTEMKRNLLKPGDLSLTLKHPTAKDKGIYTCTIYRERNILMKKEVELQVRVQWVEVDSGEESVQLHCKTTVHLPEDVRVEWTDKDYKEVYVPQNLVTPGDLSLTLKYPTNEDRGTYTCTIYSRRGKILTKKQVKLRVKVPQVEVDSGVESVQLPCETTVHLPEEVTVEWRDSNDKKVHVYQNNSDQPEEQDQFYRGRTEMTSNLQKNGNLSLTLKYPTDWDEDTYTCTVYSSERNILMRKQVELRVKVQKVEVDSELESVQLPFKTTVHLPEDVTVEWRDSDSDKAHVYENGSDQPEKQNKFYRGRTEIKTDLLETGDLSLTLKHPTGRDSNKYICTVYSREGNILAKKHVKLGVKGCRVEVEEGVESVQLPFRTTGDLPEDAKVVWRYESMIVHVYHNGSDQAEEQDQIYRGRTEMKKDLLKTGDLSLTLKHPTDRGQYVCEVSFIGVMRQKIVELIVKEKKNFTDPPPLESE